MLYCRLNSAKMPFIQYIINQSKYILAPNWQKINLEMFFNLFSLIAVKAKFRNNWDIFLLHAPCIVHTAFLCFRIMVLVKSLSGLLLIYHVAWFLYRGLLISIYGFQTSQTTSQPPKLSTTIIYCIGFLSRCDNVQTPLDSSFFFNST